jgi:hypothetical protein
METSEVRRRLTETIDRAKRSAAARRARADAASRAYGAFLEEVATPLFRQLANALKAAGYPYGVFTPGGSVRLMSDRSADDYIELSLDTSGERPVVLARVRRARGSRVIEHETAVNAGPIETVTDELLLEFVLKELEPFVEK